MAFAVLDDFNRSDASTLGADWSKTIGTDDPAIVSNQCQFDGHSNGSTTIVRWTDDASTTVHGAKCTGIVFDAASGAADMGVVCRITDSNNYIVAKLDGGGVVNVFEVVGGSQSTLGSAIAASVASASSDVFELEMTVDGTTVDVSVTNVTQAETDTGTRTTTLTTGLGIGMYHTIQFGLGHNIDEFEGDGISSAPAIPAAPTDVRVDATTTSGRLDVSWTDSANASPVQTYQIESTTDDPGGSPTWTDVSGAQTIAQGTGTYAVTGLTDGTDYTFRVRASNTNGDSAWVETGTLKPGQVKTINWTTRESPPNSRTGDADPEVVTAARMQTEAMQSDNRHGQREGDMNTATGSSGSTTNVPGDITIDTAGDRIHVDAASQNYGDTQLRILEPIDFIAYPVSFTMNMLTSVNSLAGWARQSIVDERVAWTSFQNFNTTGPVTANGFDIQWRSDVQGPLVFQYVAGVETQLTDTTGSTGYSAGDATVEFTITASAISITVDGTEVFQGSHTVPSASLESAWLMFGAHNHATVKESASDIRQSEEYGPFTFYSAGDPDVVGMVDNNNVAMTTAGGDAFDGVEIGWDVPVDPSSIGSQSFTMASLGSGALLYFDGQDQDAVAGTANTMQVSINGNTWTDLTEAAGDFRRDASTSSYNVVTDLGGNLLGWLTTGSNTIDIRLKSGETVDTFGGPLVSNITVFTYGDAATVAPADASHSHTADQAAVSVSVTVEPADALHAHVADQASVSATVTVAPDDAAHVHSADQVAVSVAVTVAPDDATHVHTADQAAVSADISVAPDDASHGHVADQVAVSVSVTVQPDDAAHGHTADSPTVSADILVAPADATHAHSADQAAVSVTVTVAPDDATHAHTADQASVSTDISVAPDNATHGHTAESPTITATTTVAPDDAAHAHTADQPTVTVVVAVAPNDAAHGHTAESPTVDATITAAPDSASHAHTADQPTITVVVAVTPNDAAHGHTAGSPAVTNPSGAPITVGVLTSELVSGVRTTTLTSGIRTTEVAE